MALTNKEKQERRKLIHKHYNAFIPKYLANAFDEKLKNENLKFSVWLEESIEKYLRK